MKTFVIRPCRAAATSFVIAAAALAAATGCATRPATGSATVAVTRVVPSETEIPGRRLPFDPLFLRSQFDVIRSTPVLTPVVLSNDLGAVLDAAYGWHMACPDAAADRAVACLRTWTDLFIWRNTDLIGIEVSVDRAVPGAEALSRELAFDIARSYRAHAIALREAETKAAVAQLQSEIDSIRKRIAESGPGDRRALENRRDQLAKRLEWPGTLVPYAEVAVIDLPPATVEELESIPKIAFRLAVVAYEPEVQTISHPASVPETLDELLARARASGEDRVFECPLQGRPAALTHDGQRTSVQIWLDGKDHVTTSEPGPAVEVSFTPKIAENGAIDADVSMRWFSERRGSDLLASSSVCHQVFMPGRVEELGGSLLPRNGKDKKFFRAFLELNIQKNPATNALPAGLPGLYHSRGRPYSSGLVEIDESGRVSAEARDAKWHPVPATRRKLSPVGTIRPAPEAGPGLLAFTSDETGPDGKRGVGTLAFDADRLAIHWLAYDKERARPWTVEFAETGFFYDPRENLIRLDTDLATLWCDTIYRTEPSDGGVTEIVYSLWDHVGNLTPQQRRDLDEILARKIHSLSSCRAMMHLDDDLGAPLRNPYDGKPDPILDVSPDLRPAITKIIAPATNAAPAHPATK